MLTSIHHRIVIHKNCLQTLRKYSKLSYFHNVGNEPLRPLTIGKLLEETCENYGDNYAVISRHQNKKLKFYEVLDQADRLAAGMMNLGFRKGDRLGLWAPNLWEWYVANLACARGGFIMVALNPAYQPREIEYCIKKVRIKGIICAQTFKRQNFYENLKAVCPELSECEPGKLKSNHLPSLESVVIADSEETLKGTHNYNEILDLADDRTIEFVKKNQDMIQIDDPYNIQFTSGTTGHPKAAVVSHFSMANNGYYVGKRNELGVKQQKICVQVPLFHAFGTVITISAALNYGATLVLPSAGFNPQESLNALKHERCTIIHGTPTMYVDLVNAQKERKEDISAEIAVSGGANASPQLFRDMLNTLNVRKVKSVYGLSETTAVVYQSLFDDDEYKSTATVGFIHDHTEAKVVDTEGRIVPKGTPGELYVRGYFNMLDYWEDEGKTKETIGSDRWLKTGDQFVMEEDGYGRVVGRIKEMIIRGGENIMPREIEDFLNTHPDILESYVIGVPHERLGEEVHACIRLTDGRTITLEELKEFCRGNIAHFKIPSGLSIVNDFPKTASGKIQKYKLVDHVKSDMANK